MRRLVTILAMLGTLTACGGTAATPTPDEGRTIDGIFVLHAQRGNFGPSCTGSGGFSDIAAGMNLTLKDGEGGVLGTTRLSSGQASRDRQRCVFEFTFEDVPDDADFYVLGSGRRGEQTYSRDDMEAAGWNFSLEIGG